MCELEIYFVAGTVKIYLIFHRFYQRNLCLIEVILVTMAVKISENGYYKDIIIFTSSSKLVLTVLDFTM